MDFRETIYSEYKYRYTVSEFDYHFLRNIIKTNKIFGSKITKNFENWLEHNNIDFKFFRSYKYHEFTFFFKTKSDKILFLLTWG